MMSKHWRPRAEERWRPIGDYEGWYEVSNQGRVRSLDRITRTQSLPMRARGKILKAHLTRGREYVTLYRDAHTKPAKAQVHRLVAAAFIGPCPDGRQVNHIDGDPTNNAITNLEYVTPKENCHHAWATGLAQHRGSRHHMARLTEEDIPIIRQELSHGASPKALGRQYGVTHSAIIAIRKGRSWAHIK